MWNAFLWGNQSGQLSTRVNILRNDQKFTPINIYRTHNPYLASQPNKIKVPFSFAPYFVYFCNIFSSIFRCYCWGSIVVCINKFGMKSCVTLAAPSMRCCFHQDLLYHPPPQPNHISMLCVDTWPWDMIIMGCDVMLWPSNDMSSGKFDYKSKIIVWANAFPMLFVSAQEFSIFFFFAQLPLDMA